MQILNPNILRLFFNKCLVLLLLLLSVTVLSCFRPATCAQLPAYELDALSEIASQLGKKDWNFSLNPCDGNSNWSTPKLTEMPLYANNVSCNCSYPNGECHLVNITLRGQDLAGVLPPSLVKLPYLKMIDLTRNYLSGDIPPQWASTNLEILSISMNRFSGSIPKFFGNITTLKLLGFEGNLFSGTVPPELGKLVNLEHLILNSNNLTGELPPTFANLTNLKELRISSNNFTGKIPSFIQNWKQLQYLEIQAGGFEGPIPSSISALNNLIELRISDLTGEGSKFPPIRNMKSLDKLDLSFNKLEGQIPNLDSLTNVEAMYVSSETQEDMLGL